MRPGASNRAWYRAGAEEAPQPTGSAALGTSSLVRPVGAVRFAVAHVREQDALGPVRTRSRTLAAPRRFGPGPGGTGQNRTVQLVRPVRAVGAAVAEPGPGHAAAPVAAQNLS